MRRIRTTSLVLTLLCSGLAGCVSIPYYTTLRGPIRSIQVVDVETGEDVPDANVSLMSQKSERFLGPPPSWLTCPDLFEIKAARTGHLRRNEDGSFHASWGLVEGSKGICVTQPGDANEYPRGIITVDAPGYRAAKLRYTAGQIQPGWSCVETNEDAEATGAADAPTAEDTRGKNAGNRCDYQGGGVLKFYLRRITAGTETADARG